MRRLIAWLWLIPVPLTFGFDLVTGTGWPVIAGTVLAAAAVLPILVRIHAGRTPSRALRIAVLGLLVSLGFVAIAATLSLTVLWLSLITLALLGRFGARPRASVAMATLARGRAPKRPSRARGLRRSHSTGRRSGAASGAKARDQSRRRAAVPAARGGGPPGGAPARGRAPKRPSRARVIRLSHSTVRLSVAAIATNPRDTSSPRTAILRAREGVRPAWMRTRIGRTAAAARTVPAITGHPVPVTRSNPKVRGTGISHSHAMSRLIGSQSNRGLGVSAAAAGGVFDFHDDAVVGGGDVPDRRVLRQVGLP